jgi:hypothetical protein
MGFGQIGRKVRDLRSQGVQPYLFADTKKPRARRAYNEFVRGLARFRAPIEIYNEPNKPVDGARALRPSGYARMFRSASRAARSVNPDVKIISAAVNPGIKGAMEWQRRFLNKTEGMDYVVGSHLYARNGNAQPGVKASIRSGARQMRKTVRQAGDRNVWVTEAGVYRAPTMTAKQQARTFGGLFDAAGRQGINAFTAYRLFDNPLFRPDDPRERGYALIDPATGLPTAAYHALRRRAGA